jgi:cytochrome c553
MKNIYLIAFAMLIVGAGAQAADLEAGKAKAKAVCAACHGENGNSPSPDFPRLAGQYYDYLVQALAEYQNGGRRNPIMTGQAANLKPADIEDLAAYFAAQNGLEVKR